MHICRLLLVSCHIGVNVWYVSWFILFVWLSFFLPVLTVVGMVLCLSIVRSYVCLSDVMLSVSLSVVRSSVCWSVVRLPSWYSIHEMNVLQINLYFGKVQKWISPILDFKVPLHHMPQHFNTFITRFDYLLCVNKRLKL